MCRLLGVAASESIDFGFGLKDAPRSLARLSPEHPHGWGIAVHDADRRAGERWAVYRAPACARGDAKFQDVATTARGQVLVAHVRKATVGATSHLNTHPFRRGGWVFAHNGTILDVAWCESRTSAQRAREIEGDTDSERFFAFLLTRLDEIGSAGGGAESGAPSEVESIDRALATSVDAATSRPGFGAANFLLSNGRLLYAHRFGRTLFTLDRRPGDAVRALRESPKTVLTTPWSARRVAALVASEALSDEPWREQPERALLCTTVGPAPAWRRVAPNAVTGARRSA